MRSLCPDTDLLAVSRHARVTDNDVVAAGSEIKSSLEA